MPVPIRRDDQRGGDLSRGGPRLLGALGIFGTGVARVGQGVRVDGPGAADKALVAGRREVLPHQARADLHQHLRGEGREGRSRMTGDDEAETERRHRGCKRERGGVEWAARPACLPVWE